MTVAATTAVSLYAKTQYPKRRSLVLAVRPIKPKYSQKLKISAYIINSTYLCLDLFPQLSPNENQDGPGKSPTKFYRVTYWNMDLK